MVPEKLKMNLCVKARMFSDVLLDCFWQFFIRQSVQENIENCDCSQLICPLILLNNALDSTLDRSHVYFGNSLRYHDYSDQRSICAKLFLRPVLFFREMFSR